MATFTQELFHILSIQHNPSTAYHPQTDGQSECTNQKLEQYLRIFTNYHQNNWARLLPLAQYTFNPWPNATTKKAPFELNMGHIPKVHQLVQTTKSPPLNDRLATITQARKDAAEALWKSQAMELPTNFVPYCVGDRVLLEGRNLNTTHPSAKLAPRRYGPFLVTSAVSRTSYRLKLPPSWKIHPVFHASLLTPYKQTTTNGNTYQEPAPELVDGQPEWEVEAILGVKKKRQQLHYLVRWKGFSEAHDSWEPLSNLNADQLIKEYYQSHPSAIRRITYKTSPTHPPNPITIRRISLTYTIMPSRDSSVEARGERAMERGHFSDHDSSPDSNPSRTSSPDPAPYHTPSEVAGPVTAEELVNALGQYPYPARSTPPVTPPSLALPPTTPEIPPLTLADRIEDVPDP